MAYKIAGIDVHKRMLAVVIADVEAAGEFTFERRQFGSAPAQLRLLAEWLVVQQAEEVVMESTAQYWRPVWATLEREWKPVAQQRDGAAQRGGHAASGAGAGGSRGAGPQAGLRGCRTAGQAPGGQRVDPQLCAGSCAA